ncbi:ArsR family transcriptional regulator [Bacillus cereus]|uniref:ArsR family transcriptional regulator n=1 Tax=Bacillus cereus TaxID=1396 RepID=UPI000B4B7571|nr:ArsR family transcriptional regulator [Bacillus cereus]
MFEDELEVTVSENDLAMLKKISNPIRMQIVIELSLVDEYSVSELMKILGVSRSTIAIALMDLRRLNIVASRPVLQRMYYRLISEKARRVVMALI